MQCLDSLLALINTIETLTEAAVEPRPGVSTPVTYACNPLPPQATPDMCEKLVLDTWYMVLSSLSAILARSSGEQVILAVLRGYQSFTQAAGLCGVAAARNAFLASLCDFTLAKPMTDDDGVKGGRESGGKGG